MLTRIAIENYRSCLRTSIDFNPNLSVLIGPNGSGKTNILHAILLLHRMVKEERFSPLHRDVIAVNSHIRAAFGGREGNVRLGASVDAYADSSNNDVMVASRQRWTVKDRRGRRASSHIPLALAGSHWERLSPEHYVDRATAMYYFRFLTLHPEMPSWAMRQLAAVARFCGGIRYYGASQFTNPGSCPVSLQIEQEGERQRLVRPGGHARVLYNMYRAQKSQQYARFMQIVGPGGLRLIDDLRFREVPTSSFDYSVRVGGKVEVRRRRKRLVIPQFTVGRQRLSPNQLSEGTFKTLALLFHLITEDSTLLLIEEPEVCVHHGLLSSILELVKSYSDRKQMILSTHSDYVLDHVGPENVYRVTFEKPSGTTARHIRKTMTAKEYAALRQYLEQEGNLGEYWREAGFGDRP
jgi:ABC-type lipoprotein export system ATPase subunit